MLFNLSKLDTLVINQVLYLVFIKAEGSLVIIWPLINDLSISARMDFLIKLEPLTNQYFED